MTDDSKEVNQFMDKLEHPLKREVQAVRSIIVGLCSDITEQIKLKSPSFSYDGHYLASFMLREKQRVQLVFHNPAITKIESELLEGNYKDRRMAYFKDSKDIKDKKSELERVLLELIILVDRESKT